MLSGVENGLDPRAAIPVGNKGRSGLGKGCLGQPCLCFFSLFNELALFRKRSLGLRKSCAQKILPKIILLMIKWGFT